MLAYASTETLGMTNDKVAFNTARYKLEEGQI